MTGFTSNKQAFLVVLVLLASLILNLMFIGQASRLTQRLKYEQKSLRGLEMKINALEPQLISVRQANATLQEKSKALEDALSQERLAHQATQEALADAKNTTMQLETRIEQLKRLQEKVENELKQLLLQREAGQKRGKKRR